MNREVSNSDDVIDSRDVIARIEDLEGERDSLDSDYQEALAAVIPDDAGTDEARNIALDRLRGFEAHHEIYPNRCRPGYRLLLWYPIQSPNTHLFALWVGSKWGSYATMPRQL